MLHPIALGFRWRSAENVQVAIQLRAVGVDDDALDLLSTSQRQRGLAAGGRAGNEKDWRFWGADGHCDADSSGTSR